MFTGIVEEVCEVVAVGWAPRAAGSTGQPEAEARRLEIELGGLLDGLEVGASVAINGVCLTLASRGGSRGVFDVVPETWRLTNLQFLKRADRVNVERALRIGDRLGGHFVQGHVDGLGVVERVERGGGEYKLRVAADAGLMPYIVRKGSIALDGTSLTVVEVAGSSFSVALIPTTLRQTNLGERRRGDRLNIETDILARLALSRLDAVAGQSPPGTSDLSWEHLRESGFVP